MSSSLRWLLVLAGVVLLLGGGWFAVVAWRNLQGAGPALQGQQQDIGQLIDRTTVQEPDSTPESVAQASNSTDMPLVLPPGTSISIFARGLDKPRVLTTDPAGTLLVSVPSQGRVVALPDTDGDGNADAVIVVAEGLNHPHGLAFRCDTGGVVATLPDEITGKQAPRGAQHCQFYIAESDKVAAWDYDVAKKRISNKRAIVDLPGGGNHITRTILFAPDGRLLVSIGSSCNVCVEKDARRAKVLAVNPESGETSVYSFGLRNAVFMTLHPTTKEVWVTEMGRDLLGDDIPPDEVNVLKEGSDYGWPYCFGKRVHDGVFDRRGAQQKFCETTEPSALDLQAHSAPLGLAFIPGDSSWPREWWHTLLVSYHGSWNRSTPVGYKIVRYKLGEGAAGTVESPEDFISGWLAESGALGRPVDILFARDGVMYISDDKAGVIYRATSAK